MNKIKTNLAVQTTLILFYSAFHFSIPIFIVLTFPFWIVPYLIASFMIKIRTMLTWISGLKGKIIRKLSEQQIGYAILKGNGKYLRTDDNKVLIYQLYDYTIRRFMSISHLQAQTKIIEIQSQSPSALLFLINHHKISQTYTINVLNSQPINHPKIVYLYNYQINNPKKMFDCVLLFEIKRKIQQNSSLDLIKIIEFIKYHMDPEGYIIFGDYFESGQLETFITLFKLYGLIIVDQEDLTKNIDYARRLRKIKKDCEISVLEWSKKLYHDWLIAEETNKKFNVMILQNDKYNRSK